MSKIKEYYHEEISRGMEQRDHHMVVGHMRTVRDIVTDALNGEVSSDNAIRALWVVVQDFNKYDEPCQKA